MAHVTPLDNEELAGVADVLAASEQRLGFVPTSFRIMGRWPELLRAFENLAQVVQAPRALPLALKRLAGLIASGAAGCRYCQAHSATSALAAGAEEAKLRAVWEFERSPLFTETERAALRFARDAATVPNNVGEGHFDELRRHFDDDQIIELLAVVSYFGWLNRWNDTLATDLEDEPAQLAGAHVTGWTPGKHRS